MIRLMIADDHAIVRDGLKRLFAITDDIAVCGEAVNGEQVLRLLRAGSFDLILLDMTMPGVNGVDLIVQIRKHVPAVPVLILSMHNESQIASRALKAGASGYLTKDSDPETLLNAVRKVARGGRHIDSTLAEQIVFEISTSSREVMHELLSEREYQILRMLAGGDSVNDIASKLSISNKTVSTHKARLMEKMKFRSNADMVRYVIEHGLSQ